MTPRVDSSSPQLGHNLGYMATPQVPQGTAPHAWPPGLVEGQEYGLASPASLQIAPDDGGGLAASSLGLDHGVAGAPFGPSLV